MGLLALHSAHYSKVFRRLLGTTCSLRWRNDGERELVWTVDPAHPIAAGVPHPIVIDAHEMYGEHFDIPAPDELVFVSSFAGGEVFRGGCCFRRGAGRIFYFSPGDQDYPIYHHPDVRRVIANAVEWAAPRPGARACPPARTRRAGRRPRDAVLRVGVIGVGWAGQQHVAAYDALPGAKVVAIAGLEETVRRALAARYGIEHDVARWEDLLDLDGLDAVSVAVPTFLHAPIAIAALERGIHVLCEKPIARNASRGRRDGPGGARGRARARGRLQPPPARRHPGAQGGHRRRAARDGRTTRRRGGCAARGSRRSAAGSRGPSWPAAARSSTSACTCSTTRCSCSEPRRSAAVSASTYDLLGQRGLRLEPRVRQDGRRPARRRSTSRTSPRCSCAWTTGARCSSRRAGPRTGPTATSSASRSTAPTEAPS